MSEERDEFKRKVFAPSRGSLAVVIPAHLVRKMGLREGFLARIIYEKGRLEVVFEAPVEEQEEEDIFQ